MSRLTYPTLYCLVLLGFFISLSVYFYGTPAQEAERLQARIREVLGLETLVDGAESFRSRVSTERIRFPSPAVSSYPAPEILATCREFAWMPLARPEYVPEWVRRLYRQVDVSREKVSIVSNAPWYQVRGAALDLDLFRGPNMDSKLLMDSVPGVRSWNLESLAAILASRLRETWGLEAVFDTANVRLRTLPILQGDLQVERAFVARKLEIVRLPHEPIVAVRGRLHCAAASGRFQALFKGHDRDGELELLSNSVDVTLDGISELESWLDFLPPVFSDLESCLSPRGLVDVGLRFRGFSSDTGAGSVEGRVRHYGSSFSIEGFGLELQGLSGTIDLDGPRAEFGLSVERRREPLRARLGGGEVAVSGTCDEKGGSLTLRFPNVSAVRLDRVLAAELFRSAATKTTPWTFFATALQALGVTDSDAAELHLDLPLKQPRAAEWRLLYGVESAEPRRLRLVDRLVAVITGHGDHGGGELVCALGGSILAGLGELDGGVRLSWEADSEICVVDVDGLRVGESSPLRGSIVLSLDTGEVLRGFLELRDFRVATDVFYATLRRARLDFLGLEANVEIELGAWGVRSVGVAARELSAVPAGEELRDPFLDFGEGQVVGRLSRRGFEIQSLKIGERDFALTLSIGWRGRIEGRVKRGSGGDDVEKKSEFYELSGTLGRPAVFVKRESSKVFPRVEAKPSSASTVEE